MATLLKWFGGWFAGVGVMTFLAKIAGLVTFSIISAATVDYLSGKVFQQLGGYEYLQVLQLGGVTEMLGIIIGAVVFNITTAGVTGWAFKGQ